MRLRPSLLTLALLFPLSCTSPAEAPSADDSVGVQAFLQRCSLERDWNFTYPEELADEVEQARLAPFDPHDVSDVDFEAELDRALAPCGLEAQQVGSAELRTFVIRRVG